MFIYTTITALIPAWYYFVIRKSEIEINNIKVNGDKSD